MQSRKLLKFVQNSKTLRGMGYGNMAIVAANSSVYDWIQQKSPLIYKALLKMMKIEYLLIDSNRKIKRNTAKICVIFNISSS